jgi:hypothetical protein
MSSFRVREHPLAPRVRELLGAHPMIDAVHERFGVEPEAARAMVTESVLDAMDLLGSAYVTRMTRVVGRLTQLREAIHLVYERVLNGSERPVEPEALRRIFEELHATTQELADPRAWAAREGGAVEPLPAGRDLQYPGTRAGLADKPSRAPRRGDAIHGQPGRQWRVEERRTGDITLEIDQEGLYWKWPELEEGVVLHFPEYGYRVWKEPGTHAITEELLVGPSVTGTRKLTRGEDVIFSAADMGEAYRSGGTQRAHGAGSPGLGLDASYGVAHAIERINQWVENRGVEAWVRDLRDHAEPGVEYVWTTRTRKRGQMLASREYTISAIADGRIHELYAFDLSVPEGPPQVDADIRFDVTHVGPEAGRFGDRVAPPDALSEALGRTGRRTGRGAVERGAPAAQRLGERLDRVTELLSPAELNESPSRGDEVVAAAAQRKDVALINAADEVLAEIGRLRDELATQPVDPARAAAIEAAVGAVSRRGVRVSAADLRALLRALRGGRR